MVGSELSHYRISEELGRGGMGIVYRATDTRLNREVALKVLPASALASNDDRARFFREAQAAAQLHHPHIATVFEIEEAVPVDAKGNPIAASDGARPYIAMEFIDGESLADVVARGPLKLKDALEIAIQVADALKAAHTKNIVHRDIKSANIMMASDRRAKVLDFGLAQTVASTKLTQMGSTLGTVAYMSPVQAKGQEVDGRTDLWSLGVTLYELIAGRRPFDGDYEQAVVYSILNTDPEPLTGLRTGVPMELERIVNKLLAKDASRRYQTAADLIADLSGVEIASSLSGSSAKASRTSAMSLGHSTGSTRSYPGQRNNNLSRRQWIWITVSGGLLLIAGVCIGIATQPDPEPDKLMKVHVNTGTVEVLGGVTLSEDGSYIAFSGRDTTSMASGMFVYELESGVLKHVSGSESYNSLEFSPGNKWIAMNNALGTVTMPLASINTGTPTILSTDRVHLWVSDSELLMESAEGSVPYSLTLDGQKTELFSPSDTTLGIEFVSLAGLLPGTSLALALLVDLEGITYYDFGIYDLAKKEVHSVLLEDTPQISGAKYVNSGHIVWNLYTPEGWVPMARPFDLETLSFTGDAFPWGGTPSFYINWAATSTGLFARRPWMTQQSGFDIGWVDQASGAVEIMPFRIPGHWRSSSLSHSGNKIAHSVRQPDGSDKLMIVDTGSGAVTDLGVAGLNPQWSKTDEFIYFIAEFDSDPPESIMKLPATGSGEAIMVLDQVDWGWFRFDLSADESHISYMARNGTYNMTDDIVTVVSLADTSNHRTVFSSGNVGQTFLSPGGRKIAMWEKEGASYVLNLSQLVASTFVRISEPLVRSSNLFWSDDGLSFVYQKNRDIVRVTFENAESLSIANQGIIRQLPEGANLIGVDSIRNRFLVSIEEKSVPLHHLELIINWGEELKRLAPANK